MNPKTPPPTTTRTHAKAREAEALANQGKPDAAWKAMVIALDASPNDPATLSVAARIRMMQRRPDLALEYGERLVRLAPDDRMAAANLGGIYIILGREKDAVPFLEKFFERHPDAEAVASNLTAAYAKNEQYVKCERLARSVIPRAKEPYDMLVNLAMAMHEQGRTLEACHGLQQILSRVPNDYRTVMSVASFTNYIAACPDNEHLWLHTQFGKLLMDGVKPLPPRAIGGMAGRKIRVGFLSGDLRHHPVSFFLLPIVEGLDPERFEVCLYHTNSVLDRYSERFKKRATVWRQMETLDDEQAARQIERDKVDVLIELAGLTTNNRLRILAYRPAPVQATYLGYPATTGCPFVDYRIVDSLTDPEGVSEAVHVEKLVRTDPCFLCFRPPEDVPEVALTEHMRDAEKPLTFGCFGILCKYNDRTIDLWCEVLRRVPGSRLFLKSQAFIDADLIPLVKQRFAKRGIEESRLDLVTRSPSHKEHLNLYNKVDIALDTVPYCGTTTTCEATLMGVPTITNVGTRHAARVGLSLMSAVGLADLACASDEAYVERAATLAKAHGRLVELRRSLRQRLLDSPVCDEKSFATRFGQVIERMIAMKAK